MHSLFIIRTPLQLLSAYIVAGQTAGHTKNDLILINPRGNALWHSSHCVKQMATDRKVWQRVITINHRVARRSALFQLPNQLRAFKEQLMAMGPIDQVYLGADREFDNQLLVELTGNTTYIRLEDGVWSYTGPELPVLEKVKMFFWSNIVRRLAGLNGSMLYNYRGGGYGRAATADLLFKPALLRRPSPQPVQIPRPAIHAALAQVTQGMERIAELESAQGILFLGSIYVDRGQMKMERELAILKQLHTAGKEKGMRLFYKPHPFEKKDKLSFYQSQLPEMYVIDISDPIETIFYCYPNIKAVAAYGSSGLLYTDIFAKQQLIAIALFKLASLKQEEAILTKLLYETGVEIPQTNSQLVTLLRGLK